MSIILKDLFCKTNVGQKAISYIVPSIWNSWPDSIKRANILNTFKHNVKKHYLFWITHDMFMCMFICISIWLYVRVCVCVYTYAYILVYFPLNYSFSSFLWFFSFTLFSHFFLTWGTIVETRRFCPFCAMAAKADAIHFCLLKYFSFIIYMLTFNQLVCLSVVVVVFYLG